jgi:hypothetical protein
MNKVASSEESADQQVSHAGLLSLEVVLVV